MSLDLPQTTLALLFVGGLSVSTANAMWRREPRWVLAFGLPLLLCAERSGLPLAFVAWGSIIYLLFAVACLIGLVGRVTGVPTAATLIAAISALAFMPAGANARYLDLGTTSLDHPPAIGLRIEELLHILTAPRD